MAYFITRSCEGTCDTACVDVCPCDCIIGPVELATIRATPKAQLASVQLFIDPDECIHCGACVPECPVDAIHADDEAGPELRGDLLRNAEFFTRRSPL
jgi:ferredoxin